MQAHFLPPRPRAFSPVPPALTEDAHDGAQDRPPRLLRHHAALAEKRAFAAFLAPLRKAEWVVYAKRPFGGPQAVLAYLSRYTHRVAISNRRLISADDAGVTFKWKDYRIEAPGRYKTMTLPTHEFPALNRFLAFWLENLEGPLHSVTVAHSRLIRPAEIRAVNSEFRLH